jgi:putative nucleotidyltransferase with HDIG domain
LKLGEKLKTVGHVLESEVYFLNSRLRRIVNLIVDENTREKVIEIVENPQIHIGGTIYDGLSLDTSPAGISRHHSYPGGFLDHTVASAEIALTLCDVVSKVYRGKVNRDLALAGTILHDIFKPLSYKREAKGYSITALGDRIDHSTLITAELIRRELPLDLIHIVCAHHGGQAGSMWPRTVEALICHLADQADSQLNGEVLRAARYLSRATVGEELDFMTSEEAFEIVNSKTVEGWAAVSEAVEGIKQRRSGKTTTSES